MTARSWYRNSFSRSITVLETPRAAYRVGMGENRRTTYRISEAARELGISAEWLRIGERRGFFPPASRDRNGHRYYTRKDMERLRERPRPNTTRERAR